MSKVIYNPNENLKPVSIKHTKENGNSVIAKPKDQLEMSIWSKMCFGLAGAPYQMYFVTIGLFSTVYLLETAKLPPEKNL